MTVVKQQIVRSLTCKRDLEMALIAYASFLKYNHQHTKLLVHTDGSLDERDIERLHTSLPGIEVIDRKTTNEQVRDVLAQYPNCLKFRETHPLSNKILDIPILESSCIKFIDCDILFFKPFTGFFSNDCSSRFCLEDDCGYSGRLVELMKVSSNSIPEGCNTGIFQMAKQKFDLAYIEWFLSQQNLCMFPGMIEQTLFALFMGSDDAYIYDKHQISTSRNRLKISEQTIAIHFMYDFKNRFFEFAQKLVEYESNEPVTINLTKAKRLKYAYIVKRALNTRLKNLMPAEQK